MDEPSPVHSRRAAAQLLDVNVSTITDWQRAGRLGPPPWTEEQLWAVKHRPGAPYRRRGPTAPHGTVSRATAGCDCTACKEAKRADQRQRDRANAAAHFPDHARHALLEQLRSGELLPAALQQLGLTSQQVWGAARSDPDWNDQLTATLDEHRPPNLPHGRPASYTRGCRCTPCRHSITKRRTT